MNNEQKSNWNDEEYETNDRNEVENDQTLQTSNLGKNEIYLQSSTPIIDSISQSELIPSQRPIISPPQLLQSSIPIPPPQSKIEPERESILVSIPPLSPPQTLPINLSSTPRSPTSQTEQNQNGIWGKMFTPSQLGLDDE